MKSLSRGPSPIVTVKMPRELMERLDRHCRSYGLSRSAVLRQILASALDRAERGDAA